jgi:hypothetical protein
VLSDKVTKNPISIQKPRVSDNQAETWIGVMQKDLSTTNAD